MATTGKKAGLLAKLNSLGFNNGSNSGSNSSLSTAAGTNLKVKNSQDSLTNASNTPEVNSNTTLAPSGNRRNSITSAASVSSNLSNLSQQPSQPQSYSQMPIRTAPPTSNPTMVSLANDHLYFRRLKTASPNTSPSSTISPTSTISAIVTTPTPPLGRGGSANGSSTDLKSKFGSVNLEDLKQALKRRDKMDEAVRKVVQFGMRNAGVNNDKEKEKSAPTSVSSMLDLVQEKERVGKQKRKINMMEIVICLLQDQQVGVEIKERKRVFKSLPPSAVGFDIVDWLVNNCGFMYRFEGEQLAQSLINHGYLIPADSDKPPKINDDPNSYYCFQNSYLWISQNWTNLDKDYAMYLFRRSLKGSDETPLTEAEIEKLDKMSDEYLRDKSWEKIVQSAENIAKALKKMEKADKKLFLLREHAFWSVQKPTDPKRVTILDDLESELSNKRYLTDREFESKMSKVKLIKHLEKRVADLQATESLYRQKTSTVSRLLMNRCDLYVPIDPILSGCKMNPFHLDETEVATWTDTRLKPTRAELAIWLASFKDLLHNSIGVTYFHQFLEREFSAENLHFYHAVQKLNDIADANVWDTEAEKVCTDFVKDGAKEWVNIDGDQREAIEKAIETWRKSKESGAKNAHIPLDVFDDAVKSIVALMAKDSYLRFVASDIVKQLLEAAE